MTPIQNPATAVAALLSGDVDFINPVPIQDTERLKANPDVANIDLMITADFCRNCLADWYMEAAADAGVEVSKDEAREHTHGMPYAEWKASQPEATPEQLAAFKARKAKA